MLPRVSSDRNGEMVLGRTDKHRAIAIGLLNLTNATCLSAFHRSVFSSAPWEPENLPYFNMTLSRRAEVDLVDDMIRLPPTGEISGQVVDESYLQRKPAALTKFEGVDSIEESFWSYRRPHPLISSNPDCAQLTEALLRPQRNRCTRSAAAS